MAKAGQFVKVTATREPVVIWSGEHHAWWRANRSGYCNDLTVAGRYTLAEALAATSHVGPEKKIEIRDSPPVVP